MSEQSRKVLEEIKTHLTASRSMLKQGTPPAAIGLSYSQPVIGGAGNNHFNTPSVVGAGVGDVHMTGAQRSAMQILQQTNASSFGSFVYQESHFGNAILPVLPRDLSEPK